MKVAIVGTGYIAGRHAAALSTLPDIEIVGHVDIMPAAAESAAKTWGGRAYASVEDLMAADKPDAVWVCVPPFAHGQIEATCMKHRVPMYIEKPVGVDVDGPLLLAGQILDSQLVVNVGYYWRCLEVMPKLRSMLEATPPQLVRIAYHGPTAPAAWWRHQSKSGGQVVEQATHLIDTARYLLGEATVISAVSNYYDRANFPNMDIATTTAALLQFESGLHASFTASCLLGSFADTSIEFICDGRKISLSLKQLTIESADGISQELTGQDPLLLANQQFIEAVRQTDRISVPCSYAEAVATQRLCYAITNKAHEELPDEPDRK